MKSLGGKPQGARLERMQASTLWTGERFRNVHPIIPVLRDPKASMPTLGEAVEPAHAEGVEPWWRVVDASARGPKVDMPAATTLPKAMPWPID